MVNIIRPRRQPKSQIACGVVVVIVGILFGGIFTLWWFTLSASQTSNPTDTPLRIDLQTPTHSEFPILLIPAAQVYADITEVYLSDEMGWDVSNLGQKVGYLQGTARPGSERHVVLVGHVELRDGAPGVFKKLDKLTAGDIVILYVGPREIRYTVTEVFETDAYNLSVISDSADQLLTLITCADYDFIANTYQKRLVVQAKKI